jgi:hypothetical protein
MILKDVTSEMINAKRQRDKREFEEFLEVLRKGETLIEKYCRAIRNQPGFFEMTFEDYEKAWDERKKMLKKKQVDDHVFNKFISEKPKGMSKAEWIKQKRRMKKNRREQERQLKLDRRLEFKMTPIHLFEDQVDKIGCECEAEGIRQGQFCDTCRLITNVNSYMMKLFKDFAEGRSTLFHDKYS